MDIEEVNDSVLQDLASLHRSYFVTGLLTERIAQTPLSEIVLYAYGVIAGGPEVEELRADRDVREHEGCDDCEISPHFWRGVCDARGATLGLAFNKKPRKKTESTGHAYPYFRMKGSQLLLARLYDFFKLYAPYPQAANEQFEKQIDDEKGGVYLTGMPAQMAVYNLYDGAHVGNWMDKAQDVIEWKGLTGWNIGKGLGSLNPAKRDLSKLKPVPSEI
jgi:hypothetical protein